MLTMFSKSPDAKKAKENRRIDPKLGKGPDPRETPRAGSRQPVRVLELINANADRPKSVPAPAGLGHRAKVFENAPSVGQYLFHLSSDIKSATRAETQSAVMHCSPVEVQRVGRLLAKLKGRYLAQLIDLGAVNRGPVGEVEIANLQHAREMAEEIERGFDALRHAIENGDLRLDGVKAE